MGFPDYWVYFKALYQSTIYKRFQEFPDYWVYFKAPLMRIEVYEDGEHFQTIESILKRCSRFVKASFRVLFPDYWVYFKANKFVWGNYQAPIRFPDYWVYFKADGGMLEAVDAKEFPDYWVYFKAFHWKSSLRPVK